MLGVLQICSHPMTSSSRATLDIGPLLRDDARNLASCCLASYSAGRVKLRLSAEP